MTLDVALHIAFCGVFALVLKLFAPAKANAYFDVGTAEINFQRNKSHTLLLNSRMELHDLAFMHQKSANTKRIAVENISLFVRADVHSVDEDLAVFDIAPAVLKVHMTGTDAFYFGTEKFDPRFVFFINKIVMKSLFVVGNALFCILFIHFPFRLLSDIFEHTHILLRPSMAL